MNKYLPVIYMLILSFFSLYGEERSLQSIIDESFSIVPSGESKKGVDDIMYQKLNYRNLSNDTRKTQSSPTDVIGFDVCVDESKYILGTGDGLTIYLWGSINDKIQSIIDHEGNFVLSSIGIVNLRNLTLREGKEVIRNKILSSYKEVEMSIVLSKVREFKVYLLGGVTEPGHYFVNGAMRVSDLIIRAGGVINDSTPCMRGIRIENESHPIRYADLAIFYHNNSVDKNPYLLEGDRVFVPKRKEILTIFGGVNFPGEYDYMPGDTLITVLNAAGGLTRGADSSKIVLNRFLDNKDSLITYEFSFVDSSVYNFLLERDDRILVCNIPDYRVHRKVFVKGEVTFPGVYPIRDDKTKLVDVIAMAGGLTDKAFLRGSKIIRKQFSRVGNREFERLKKIPLDNLTPMERSYLKTKLTEEDGIVSINFEDLLKNGRNLYNIVLRNNDKITIACQSLSIKVTGAVVSPGLVSFKDRAGYKYYIIQAGGFNSRARKRSVMIVKGGTEIWLKPDKVQKLEAGDAVWIPEKQYRDKLQVTKDILGTLGSIATIVIMGFTIREFNK